MEQPVIHYNNCPGCNSGTVHKVLSARDHTVSGQVFEVWECASCSLRFTQDVPEEASIAGYYQSENYISHTDTRKGLVNRLYHHVRNLSLHNKRKLIEASGKWNTRSLLDVGAGTGAFVNHMKQHGWRVTGIEPDEQARRNAGRLYNLSLLPAEDLWKIPAGEMDVITLWHVLEHVHRLHEYLEHLKNLMKPGGLLCIAVPNYTSGDAAAYGEYWAAYDVPRHLYHFSPMAIKQLLARHGLVLKKIKPMWFDSFYVSLLSEKYKNGKPSLVKGGWNGALSNSAALWNHDRCSSLIYFITR